MRTLFLSLLLAHTLDAQPQGLTIVAPAAPGGGWDQLARTMARVLEGERIASAVQVENIPGAAGTVGLARFVSGRRGDPGALLVTGLVMVGGVVQNKSPVTLRETTPIARLVGEYEAIAVPASSPFRSLSDLIAELRRSPGSIAWGGGSAGGTDQILVDLLAQASGVDPARTNYVAFAGGGEARTALLGAQVQAGVSGLGEFAELARAGSVRILAVSSAARISGWDVPTLRESGIDVVLANWRGVVAPPGLTAVQRDRLESALRTMQASPAWRAELERRGWDPLPLGGEAFGRFAESEMRRVQQLVARKQGGTTPVRTTRPSPLLIAGVLAVTLLLGLRGRTTRVARVRPAALAWIATGIGLNILLSEWLGFVAGAALLFGCTAFAFGERRHLRVLAVSLVFSVVVFVVFRGALSVALPTGRLWQVGAG